MVAGDAGAAQRVDGSGDGSALLEGAGLHDALAHGQAGLGLDGVGDLDLEAVCGDGAGVAHLAAHLTVEGGLVEHDADLGTGGGRAHALALDHDGLDGCLGGILDVAGELGLAQLLEQGGVDVCAQVPCVVLAGVAGALALGLHLDVEALLVDLDALLCADLAGELVGEAVGVVQGEGDGTGEGVSLLQALEGVFQEALAVGQGLAEALLLRQQGLGDERLVLDDLRVLLAHGADDLLEELAQEGLVDALDVAVAHGAAQQAAQHIAAALVGGQDAVADHEHDGAGVVCHDAQGEVDLVLLAVLLAGEALAHADEAAQDVCVEVGGHALQDGGGALQAHAGVDVLLLKRHQGAVLLAVVLGEDAVPVLQEAVAVAAGGAVGVAAADFLALVVVELGAGAAGAGGAGAPEVVVFAQAGDMGGVDAHALPDAGGLLVLLVDGDVDLLGVELHHLGGELPGPLAHLLLEVLAEGEVAEHLEEAQVAAVCADDVDVIGAHALLGGGGADVLGVEVLLLQEVGLELHHARNGQQQGGVVGDEGGRRPVLAALLLEELEVGITQLGACHSLHVLLLRCCSVLSVLAGG